MKNKKVITKNLEDTLNYIQFFRKCARMKNKKVITKNLEMDELYRMSTTRALKNVSLKRYLRLKFQDNTMSGFSWSRIPWDWVRIFAKSNSLGLTYNFCKLNPRNLTSNFKQFLHITITRENLPPGCKVFSTCLARSFHLLFPFFFFVRNRLNFTVVTLKMCKDA